MQQRKSLAAKVFRHISGYDAVIANHLESESYTEQISFGADLVQMLRYGENPQQKAAWYKMRGVVAGLHEAQILQGKELSYNNLLDLDAAIQCLREFDEPASVAVKHNNSCGVATHMDSYQALKKALMADPTSVFGGIVAVNFDLTDEMVEETNKLFLECLIAPGITEGAKTKLTAKKNLRVMIWPGIAHKSSQREMRPVLGGILIQDSDEVSRWDQRWQIHGAPPSDNVKRDLIFANRVVRHLKSNAIAICESEVTLGLGMGQVNRVDSVEHAIQRMKKNHPGSKSPVLASDAFFPFADSIEKIAEAGIRWVIQPGGSLRDQEVIEKAAKLNVNLIMTGERHFRH